MFMQDVYTNPEQKAESPPEKKQDIPKEVVEKAEFFSPMQVPERSEVFMEKDTEVEQRLQELLRSLSEETIQLKEFLGEENRLMNELCVSIKQITRKLDISLDIPPSSIPVKKKVKRVILNEEGCLTLFSEKEVHSAFLAEYPPEIVMAVLWVVMPKLAQVVVRYRKKVGKRVNIFRKLKNELKSIARTVIGSQQKAEKLAGENKRC
ncbi:hypothetical protein KAW04_02970 [Candidatus Bathyarchaeota archaeon]|nr:hypothetical protein [Candidatus Bathyarchaeota archaeon]